MDRDPIDLSRGELDFLKHLLQDLQQELGCGRPATDAELTAAVTHSLATLQSDGRDCPPLEARPRPVLPIRTIP
ncbi:hypothetical protein LZ009_03950 [Ramlibacter sp. XY19]|uniref:hypothetical protein n=1 Tax=Ramlibacter paludis TaxID=2908000 RepID=UPI0023DCA3FA|nr:hypothetical protein [Ramlibacter paludis]MCG2591926.1 hypothetical protein [Ramlibacter paludis]